MPVLFDDAGVTLDDPTVTFDGVVVFVDVADSTTTVTATVVSQSTVEAVAASTTVVGG